MDLGPFKAMECGQSGSELYNFERTVADVKKKIEDALNTFGLGGAGPGEGAKNRRRRKRRQLQVGQSNGEWACAKVVLPGTAYRSCVKKTADFQVS